MSDKKTVADLFKKAPKTVFYIGSASGFFFIGDSKAWKECSNKINNRCKDLYEMKQLAAHKNLPKILDDIARLADQKKKDKNAIHARIAVLEKTMNSISTPWVDIWDREPKKVSEKEGESGYAIVVEGIEDGDFWLKNEFDKRYGRL